MKNSPFIYALLIVILIALGQIKEQLTDIQTIHCRADIVNVEK